MESLPTQLREWILGPELAREGEVALSTSVIQARIRGNQQQANDRAKAMQASKEAVAMQCEPPADRSRARSPSTRPSPFGLANKHKKRRRVAPSSPS